MSDIKNGGPAFPSGEAYSANGVISRKGPLYEGMTMRDYFAAHAMQGFIRGARGMYGDVIDTDENIAKSAYKMADAMIAEREK